jgi:hypothetical protein
MPPEIALSINEICAKVKMAVKEHLNKHGGYKYVSYDRFLEDIGPLMAEAGLILVMHEADAVSDGKWLTLTFHIYLYHKSGKSYGPVVRSQGVLANGPQAYAAAQSFAEKYFIRQLFKVPTGEEDADADSQGKAPIPASKKPAKPDNRVSAELSEKARDVAIAALQMCADIEALDSWGVDNKSELARMQDADVMAVRAAFKTHRENLTAKKEAA